MALVLNSLGYTNIIRRSIRPGTEIDLEADHKTSNIHLICECKAYKRPIATRSLRDFFGNYNYEQPEENTELKAAFFSISGHTGQSIRGTRVWQLIRKAILKFMAWKTSNGF
jgi:hypothetical protein